VRHFNRLSKDSFSPQHTQELESLDQIGRGQLGLSRIKIERRRNAFGRRRRRYNFFFKWFVKI
jgi:hypothetical protein